MNDGVLIEALDDCLRAMEAGATLEAVLARHPQLADELRPMLTAVQSVRPMQPLRVPRQSEEASHARFMARARELRRSHSRAARGRWSRFSLVPRLALAVLALALGGFGVVTASTNSLPGDPLYGVKRTVEQAQLSLAPAEARPALEREFEQRRLAETQAVLTQQREVEVEFTGLVQAVIGERWQIAGFTVQVRAGLAGDAGVGDTVKVWGRTRADGLIIAARLEKRAEGGMPAPTPTAEPSATPPAPTTQAPALTATPQITETSRPTAIPPTATPTPGTGVSPAPMNTLPPTPAITNTVSPTMSPPATVAPAPIVTAAPTTSPPTTVAPTSTGDDTETPEPEEIEFEGVVESTGGVWVIGGQTVVVNAQTEFRNNPQTGDWVRVKAWRLTDGTLVARRIEKKN
ncbi:MAG: DUF5666 domain-containing protein [Anaerolineales bacterium]|nr:DUF5666 domain-containing protein [Anaerolineales bacterium]